MKLLQSEPLLFPGGGDLTRAQDEGIQQISAQRGSPTIGRHIQGILTTSKLKGEKLFQTRPSNLTC